MHIDMNIKKFKSVEQAIRVNMFEDRDYILIRHTLQKGGEIKTHYHKKAGEAVIFDSGAVIIRVGNEEKTINLKKGEKVVVVKFPSKLNHWLLAKSKISYFVLRDRKDRNIYVKGRNK